MQKECRPQLVCFSNKQLPRIWHFMQSSTKRSRHFMWSLLHVTGDSLKLLGTRWRCSDILKWTVLVGAKLFGTGPGDPGRNVVWSDGPAHLYPGQGHTNLMLWHSRPGLMLERIYITGVVLPEMALCPFSTRVLGSFYWLLWCISGHFVCRLQVWRILHVQLVWSWCLWLSQAFRSGCCLTCMSQCRS